MESMDITYSIPRVNWNVSEKMPYSNSFFPKLSKEHFTLKTIYETLYIFFMIGGRTLDWDLISWASTEIQQTAFQLTKVPLALKLVSQK